VRPTKQLEDFIREGEDLEYSIKNKLKDLAESNIQTINIDYVEQLLEDLHDKNKTARTYLYKYKSRLRTLREQRRLSNRA